jgi:hypothetical protein
MDLHETQANGRGIEQSLNDLDLFRVPPADFKDPLFDTPHALSQVLGSA